MINLQIRNFRETVLAVVNQERLPVEVKRLVLSEILNAIQDKCDEVIENEKIEQQKELMKQQEKEKEEENEQSIQQNILAE